MLSQIINFIKAQLHNDTNRRCKVCFLISNFQNKSYIFLSAFVEIKPAKLNVSFFFSFRTLPKRSKVLGSLSRTVIPVTWVLRRGLNAAQSVIKRDCTDCHTEFDEGAWTRTLVLTSVVISKGKGVDSFTAKNSVRIIQFFFIYFIFIYKIR